MMIDKLTDTAGEIKLFLKNVWLLFSFDPFNKPFFSLLCGIFSLMIYRTASDGFIRLLALFR